MEREERERLEDGRAKKNKKIKLLEKILMAASAATGISHRLLDANEVLINNLTEFCLNYGPSIAMGGTISLISFLNLRYVKYEARRITSDLVSPEVTNRMQKMMTPRMTLIAGTVSGAAMGGLSTLAGYYGTSVFL